MGNARLELRYVVDADLHAAQTAASKVPHCKAIATIDEALADKDLKGVIICTPTAQVRTSP
jgi:predicted dehydrogenase